MGFMNLNETKKSEKTVEVFRDPNQLTDALAIRDYIWRYSLVSFGKINFFGKLEVKKKISENTFESYSNNRRVTVKFENASKIDREMKILSNLDHTNILKFYYDIEVTSECKFLVSEFFEFSLAESFDKDINHKSTIHQLARGVKYLQESSILHLNLSPRNIVLFKHNSRHLVKLANFYKARKIDRKYIHIKDENFAYGDDNEFCAPELLKHNFAHRSSDIFSSGKIFLFILENHKKSEKFLIDPSDAVLWKKLCNKLISNDFAVRLKQFSKILEHPLFWSAPQTLHFIVDIAKMLETDKTFRKEIYKESYKVFGGKEWTSKISSKLFKELINSRKAYSAKMGTKIEEINGTKITSLIFTIRNMSVHALTEEIAAIVGRDEDAIMKYWSSRFPQLILHLYEVKLKHKMNKKLEKSLSEVF